MQTDRCKGNRTLEPVRKQVKEDGRKMEQPGNGTEDSKERRRDRGRLTHTKLPPAAPGDLGSGVRFKVPTLNIPTSQNS